MVSLAVLHSRLARKPAGAGVLNKAMSKESKVTRGDLCGPHQVRMGSGEDCRTCSVVGLMMRRGWGWGD